jgi:DNA polymerase III sliding clamp (beta) subunit (PCNA family)
MEIIIKLNELQAVSYAMAKGDIRYYLNSILLEIDAEGNHRIVATDGHRVHIVDNGLTKVAKSYIIPREAVEQALKIKLSFVTFKALSETEGIFKHAAGGIQFKFIEGRYPDYRRVIPESLQEIQAGQYDVNFLSDALKAMQAYKQKKQGVMLDIIQQGEGLGVAVYERLFVGMMACRVNMEPVKAEAQEMIARIKGNV